MTKKELHFPFCSIEWGLILYMYNLLSLKESDYS